MLSIYYIPYAILLHFDQFYTFILLLHVGFVYFCNHIFKWNDEVDNDNSMYTLGIFNDYCMQLQSACLYKFCYAMSFSFIV